jgi:hypothetical protein
MYDYLFNIYATGFSWCVTSTCGTIWLLRNSQQRISLAILTWIPTTSYQMMSSGTSVHWDSVQRWYVSPLNSLITVRIAFWLAFWMFILFSIACVTTLLYLWVVTYDWFLFADLWRCIKIFQGYLPYTITFSRSATLEVNVNYIGLQPKQYRLLNVWSLLFGYLTIDTLLIQIVIF